MGSSTAGSGVESNGRKIEQNLIFARAIFVPI